MEHKVIRYQAFRHMKGMDLACKCGERWYLRPDRPSYKMHLAEVAMHFSWLPPPLGAPATVLTDWLINHLPANLAPKGP